MRRLSWLLLAIAAPALAAAPDGGLSATPSKPDGGVAAAPEKPVGYLKTAEDKELYALGYSFGRNPQVFDLSPAELEIVRKALSEGRRTRSRSSRSRPTGRRSRSSRPRRTRARRRRGP
jgi:hypothetical protein